MKKPGLVRIGFPYHFTLYTLLATMGIGVLFNDEDIRRYMMIDGAIYKDIYIYIHVHIYIYIYICISLFMYLFLCSSFVCEKYPVKGTDMKKTIA